MTEINASELERLRKIEHCVHDYIVEVALGPGGSPNQAYDALVQSTRRSLLLEDPKFVKRFHLQRDADETGISGTGIVAEGCQFSNGWCAMTWLTEHTSVVWYPSIDDVEFIHGHGGKTQIVWQD